MRISDWSSDVCSSDLVGSQDTADFLPADAPSQQADRILADLFPDDPTREAAIIVVAREGGLTDADRTYIGQVAEDLRSPSFADDISGVQTVATDPDLGPFLRSEDGAAELMVASMRRAPFSTNGTQAVEELSNHLETTVPDGAQAHVTGIAGLRSEEHTSELQSLMRTSYAVFC